MKKKSILLTVAISLGVIILYNSFYIKKLDEMRQETAASAFDANAYTDSLWQHQLPKVLTQAQPLAEILTAIRQHPQEAFEKYAKSLGIGYLHYFLVKGTATVLANERDSTLLQLEDGSTESTILLQTEYIYGNAARDATGLVDITTFSHTGDLNKVSELLNQRIREQVIKPYKTKEDKTDRIEFVAAIELNSKFPDLDVIELIPLELKIIER